jgi:FeS assembly protein IscX
MHWNDIELIVEKLEETYSEEEIPDYNLPYVLEMVYSLPEFEDKEVEVEDDHLKRISEAWLDIRE